MSVRCPSLDKTTKRYFVYTLRDADGAPVYVGRSCNPRSRIREHYRNRDCLVEGFRTAWILDVRSVDLTGPYTWDEAVAAERDAIERLQPRGNRQMTARDWRPSIARRSASRAERTPEEAGREIALTWPPITDAQALEAARILAGGAS